MGKRYSLCGSAVSLYLWELKIIDDDIGVESGEALETGGKEKIIRVLSTEFIIHRDFTPLRDGEGNIVIGETVNVLVKNSSGSLVILEIIDGDLLSAGEIQARLAGNTSRLADMNAARYHYIFEVFLFRSEVPQDKAKALESGQSHRTMDRKFLKCVSVSLESGAIEKYFKVPLTDFGITSLIRTWRESGVEEASSEAELEEVVRRRESERGIEFKSKTPWVTYGLITLNILVWGLLNLYALLGAGSYDELLSVFGAKVNINILQGEYWRFLTPVVLHSGILHLVINCYSLYAVGVVVERIFGHGKFLVIYLAAGILGNIASFSFSANPAVGASGAIFGLMGALLYFGLKKPAAFKTYFGHNVIAAIIINLTYGFSRAGIDNYAHMGGLVGGFLATGIVNPTVKEKWYLRRLLFVIVAVALTGSGLYYGFSGKQNRALVMVHEMEQYDREQQWSKAEEAAEKILGLELRDLSTRVEALWTLAKVEAMQNKYDEAVEHAQLLIRIDPKNGHYLLGLLYYDMQQYEHAKEELLQAKALEAPYENIDALLKDIDTKLK